MPVNTITVATAVTPTVIETYIAHYINRKPLRQKPTAHISYHEGLELIRRFLHYASFHTVEELQAFTSQWVPAPVWVYVKEIEIPTSQLSRSADYITAQLGPEGVGHVGGKMWWQWRRDNAPLKAEWIEMRKDYDERKRMEKGVGSSGNGQRIMLYVHGGAYYFGSVDEHRYQMQRHARKLKARVLAPRYRLAPQFPFPCGLHDCLAAYLYLLEEKHDPSTIILAGDSAGGGMVLSVLVTLRDQGIPLPAGAILISPWVDLTHSFPSLGGDGKMDYIPAHGFVHKPSISWPPPNADDILAFESSLPNSEQKENKPPQASQPKDKEEKEAQKEETANRVRGFSLNKQGLEAESHPTVGDDEFFVSEDGKYSIGPKSNPVLSVQLADTRVEIKDQIQMYAPNHLLTHPLVSPALQPTLGGLPPLLIQTGGGELLHDEQVYLAHKAAQPLAYPPPPSNHQTAEAIQAQLVRYRPTNVQLQVWDDLCHVAPTLSFTRPAKYMYRSIAQFGAWALARAQKTSIDILDDDSISVVSHGSSESSATTETENNVSPDEIKLSMPQSAQHVGFESVSKNAPSGPRVGKAGDPLPAFENHMIRQRVDRNGYVYTLAPKSDLVALNLPNTEIGVPKPGPVNKWMKAQKQWNGKFAKQKLKVQRRRLRDMQTGYERFEEERPPPTALAGRRVKGMKAEKSKKKSWGMALWSLLGSKHDEATLHREEVADQDQANLEDSSQSNAGEATDGVPEDKPTSPSSSHHRKNGLKPDRNNSSRSRSHSRVTTVTDKGQIAASMEDLNRLALPTPGFADATKIAPERKASPLPSPTSDLSSLEAGGSPTPGIMIGMSRPQSPNPPTLVPDTDGSSTRPTRGGIAYPFSLKVGGENRDVNPSVVTLQSVNVQDGEGLASEIVSPEAVGDAHNGEIVDAGQGERPAVERFVTADAGDLLKEAGKENGVERPGVERFETAQEDLSVLTKSNKS